MIADSEYRVIRGMVDKAVARVAGRRQDYFVTGKVLKNDKKKKLVWLKEFGDQAIPVVGFDYTIDYFDTNAAGVVVKKTAKAKFVVPKQGQTVLVARELGVQRLPRCLGVIQGTGWNESVD